MIEIPDYIDTLISENKPLTPDEQLILLKAAQGGCEESKEKLILSNIRFVVREVCSIPTVPIRLEFTDLLNAGIQGMLEALELFDTSSSNNFLTYAYWWIKKRLIQTLYRNVSVIHIPKEQVKQLERLHFLCEKNISMAMANPGSMPAPQTAMELAHELFWNTDGGEGDEQLKKNRAAFLRIQCAWEAHRIESLPLDDSGSLPLMLSVEDSCQEDIEYLEELERCMYILDEREEDILKRHFGIGCSPQDYSEIASRYILTPERVRQLLQGALTKIRELVLPIQMDGED